MKASVSNNIVDIDSAIDQVLNLLIGGIETSAFSLVAALYYLAKMPQLNAKFFDYIQNQGTNCSNFYKRYQQTDINNPNKNCDVLDSFIFEVLRLYPPVWILSRSQKTKTSCDHKMTNKNTWISLFDIQRDANYWEDENTFRGERFCQRNNRIQSYMPFGQGPRQCVAKNLALTEIREFIKMIVSNFNLLLPVETHTRVTAKVNLLLKFDTLIIKKKI